MINKTFGLFSNTFSPKESSPKALSRLYYHSFLLRKKKEVIFAGQSGRVTLFIRGSSPCSEAIQFEFIVKKIPASVFPMSLDYVSIIGFFVRHSPDKYFTSGRVCSFARTKDNKSYTCLRDANIRIDKPNKRLYGRKMNEKFFYFNLTGNFKLMALK